MEKQVTDCKRKECVMLVLSRQKDEDVDIILNDVVNELTTKEGTDLDNLLKELTDDDGDIKVTVTVVDVRGDKVRLGFTTASKKIIIHRREVWLTIKREKATKTQAEQTESASVNKG